MPALDPWPFVILSNQMMAYLVGSTDQQLNYLAGQTAVLHVDSAAERRGYMLTTPGGLSLPIPADVNRRDVPIPPTEEVGNYRLQAGGGGQGGDLGFSVNYAPEQTRLDRLTERELSDVFGPVKYRLARTRDQIDRDISMTPRGTRIVSAGNLARGGIVGIGNVDGKSVLSGMNSLQFSVISYQFR